MTSKCSFCQNQVRKIELASVPVHICPSCYAIVLPAEQWSSVKSSLDAETCREWVTFLKTHPVSMESQSNATCLLHGSSLDAQGKAPCCGLLHLNAANLLERLERSMRLPERHPSLDKGRRKGIIRRIAEWISPAPSADEDPFGGLTWHMTLKPILEGK